MSSFNFNRLYVIESLNGKLTGKELYDDLLKWQEDKFKELKVNYIPINSKTEFFEKIDEIKKECIIGHNSPILHFEMHGSTLGLMLNSSEFVTWQELYNYLVAINYSIGNNLFLTLAICHGAHLMQIVRIDQPSPLYGFIGSFDEIKEYDLSIRYYAFYQEFFTSFKIEDALMQLHNSNPKLPSTYKFISAEETFLKVYSNYIKDNLSKEGIKKRKKQVIIDENLMFKNRKERRRFEKDFEKKIEKTKERYYKEHSSKFFMVDKFPNNQARFDIPNSLSQLQQRISIAVIR
jgi:hypothetical protein